ncbi:MAG TPA: hypothetical protein VI299_11485 [Polyangiales bacterium]
MGIVRPVALLQEQGRDFREVLTERGCARLWVLAPDVYVTFATGYMEEPHAVLFESFGADRIKKASGGKLTVFHDWLDMTGYDSRCRARLTSWSIANLDHYDAAHFGVRSKIVAMGVQVANMALRGFICAHTSRPKLEAELRRAMVSRGLMSEPQAVVAR